jgi:RNA polymerase sigma factor (sigma-70 family)
MPTGGRGAALPCGTWGSDMSEDFVKPYVPMDRAVERALIARGQAGDVEARNEVIMNTSLLAWKASMRWNKNRPSMAADSYSLAMQRLCEKFNQFDLGKGVRFSTWATSWINNAMHESLHERRVSSMTCPRRNSKAGYTVLTEHQRALALNVASLDGMKPDYLRAFEPAGSKDADPAFGIVEKQTVAFVQRILGKMRKRHREVLERRTAGQSLSEIGFSMGVSKERIRQIEMAAHQNFADLAKWHDEKLYLELEQQVCWANRFRRKKVKR